MNQNDWAKIIQYPDKIVGIHPCVKNGKRTIGVIKCQFEERPESGWMLISVWIAGNEEVLDGEAEKVGEIMNSSMIAICYCPFCGVSLKA